jgi:hypothetical protein
MTTKADYTTEEWDILLQAPPNAAMYVITADMSVMGALKEVKALSKALKKPSAPAAAQGLVDALVADIQEKSKNKESVETQEVQESEEAREQNRQGLQQAAALLDAKCSPEEAAGFKQWLLDVAEAVAEADKEGSHFGFGGVRVTDKEKAAMAEIKSTLGL